MTVSQSVPARKIGEEGHTVMPLLSRGLTERPRSLVLSALRRYNVASALTASCSTMQQHD